ncbi:hypothetical protein M758_2G006900 [Ceratodon purpureus]|uniref:Methyltransferase type 11 domain-containing protein n=1 Tax=Ceratodon purpureus TaxID=3225 RepID=A0A8T0IQQ8_CERPU|nr:hypothetical protein KC19_2G007000 [Ceratodon purpureus]KAG0624822.1 hypothetical protein M758_2G006900 [Ceratodon purpureus]
MAFACTASSCVTGSTLQWRLSPLHPVRPLSSSSMFSSDAAKLLRLRVAAPALLRIRRRAPRAMALPAPTEAETQSFLIAVAVTGALSFGVFRAIVYFRMQYFIAAMLGRHVPKGGARVLDLGIREGRNLYYYPKDTVQVIAVTSKPNLQLLESQGVNAKVPIRVAPDCSKIPANSMDAVVSVYGMAEMSDEEVASALSDAARVLKPGKPLIYVENVGSENALVRAAQQLIESIAKVVGSNYRVTRDVLPFVQNTEGLGDLKYETILGFQDPHLVGIAIKQGRTPTTTPSGIGKERVYKKDRAPKKDFAPKKVEFPGQ